MNLVPIEMDQRGISASEICNAFTIYSIGSITASYFTAKLTVGSKLFAYTAAGFFVLIASSTMLAFVDLIDSRMWYVVAIYTLRFVMGAATGQLMTFGLDIGIKNAPDSNHLYLLSLVEELLCSVALGLGPYFSSVILETSGMYSMPYYLSLLVTVPISLWNLTIARKLGYIECNPNIFKKTSSINDKNELESLYTGSIVNNKLDVYMLQQKRDKTFVFNYHFNKATRHINRSERIDLTSYEDMSDSSSLSHHSKVLDSNTNTQNLNNLNSKNDYIKCDDKRFDSISEESSQYAYSMNDVDKYLDELETEETKRIQSVREERNKLDKYNKLKNREKFYPHLNLSEPDKNFILQYEIDLANTLKKSSEPISKEKGPELHFEIEQMNNEYHKEKDYERGKGKSYGKEYEMSDLYVHPCVMVNIVINVYVSGVAMNLENQIANNLYKEPYNLSNYQIGFMLTINSILSSVFIGYQLYEFWLLQRKKREQQLQGYLIELREEDVAASHKSHDSNDSHDFRNQIVLGLALISLGNCFLSPQNSWIGVYVPWGNSFTSFFLLYSLLQVGWILAYFPLMTELTQSACRVLDVTQPARVSEAVSGIFNISWQSGFLVLLYGGTLTDYIGFDNMNVVMGMTGAVLTTSYYLATI